MQWVCAQYSVRKKDPDPGTNRSPDSIPLVHWSRDFLKTTNGHAPKVDEKSSRQRSHRLTSQLPTVRSESHGYFAKPELLPDRASRFPVPELARDQARLNPQKQALM